MVYEIAFKLYILESKVVVNIYSINDYKSVLIYVIINLEIMFRYIHII